MHTTRGTLALAALLTPGLAVAETPSEVMGFQLSRLITSGASCGQIARVAERRYGFECGPLGGAADATGSVCRTVVDMRCVMPSGIDLYLVGDDYTPHEGQTVYANVVRDADGVVVANGTDTVVDYHVEITLEGAVEMGESYHVDYFADHNGNGVCDYLYEDHIWQSDSFTVDDDPAEVTIDHTGLFTDAGCDSF